MAKIIGGPLSIGASLSKCRVAKTVIANRSERGSHPDGATRRLEFSIVFQVKEDQRRRRPTELRKTTGKLSSSVAKEDGDWDQRLSRTAANSSTLITCKMLQNCKNVSVANHVEKGLIQVAITAILGIPATAKGFGLTGLRVFRNHASEASHVEGL